MRRSKSMTQEQSPQRKQGRIGHESLMDFNLKPEIEHLHNEEVWMRTGRNLKPLVKKSDFRIVLIALQSGEHIEERSIDARIAMFTLRGRSGSIAPPEHKLEAGREPIIADYFLSKHYGD